MIAAAPLTGAPAYAQSRDQPRASHIDIAASRLDAAIRRLSSQSGTSIGFRDSRLARQRVRAVRGTFTPDQALERLLAGTQLHARRVATDTYLIEAAPRRPAPPRRVARPANAPTKPFPKPAVEEIVVTATKRDVPLSTYPGGVQVIGGDEISTADAGRGSDTIGTRVASVVSTHLGPGRNKLFIRGIADSSFVGPTQATVGQYWGNSRITYSAPDPSLRLFDIRSIEVLEGPQGTLYGAGSLGGVVRVVPNAPNLSMASGSAWLGVQAVQHGQPGADGGALINLPLVDGKLALRALAFGSVDGGYIDDTERKLKDVNTVRTLGGRGTLRYSPGNDWTIDLSGVGQRIHGDDSQYADRDGGDGLSRASSIAQPFRNDYWLADLVARKRWGTLELTSSIGYTSQYVFEQFLGKALADGADPAMQPAANAASSAFVQTDRISLITGETRLARRGADGNGWVIGLSVLHNRAQVNRQMRVEGLSGSGMGIPLTGVHNQVDEQTLYGEGSITPIDRVTVTAGGRLTHSRLAGNSEDAPRAVAFRFDPTADAARSETRLLPSAAIAYRATDRLTMFGRYQQGYRPGGIAVRLDYVQRFKGDRVATTEAGARYTSRNFNLSLTGSWTRWNDIQADMIDGFGFPATVNVGDGRVLSVGIASRWKVTPALALDGALYLNESKVTSRATLANSLIQLTAADFARLPNVADASGRLGLDYHVPLSDKIDVDVTGFARYVGKSTLGVGSILSQLQGDYLDTGLEIKAAAKSRAVTLSITNLLDARGNRFALGSPFLVRDRNQITPLQPRSIRLGFEAAF